MRGFRLPGNSGQDASLWRCFGSVQSREEPRKVWDAPGTPRIHIPCNCEVCMNQPADGPTVPTYGREDVI